MPLKDGSGPPKGGKGRGGSVSAGGSGGRMGGDYAAGPEGKCMCLNCGATVLHSRGVPCNGMVCPDCGSKMTRALTL